MLNRIAKLVTSIEFYSKEEFDKYMKDHPNANPQNHSVKPKEEQQDPLDGMSFEEAEAYDLANNQSMGTGEYVEEMEGVFKKGLLGPVAASLEIDPSWLLESDMGEEIANTMLKSHRLSDDTAAYLKDNFERKPVKHLNDIKDVKSKAQLQELAAHPNSRVRAEVAKNPNVDHKTLDSLSSDENEWVRGNVAKNPNTSQSTLDKLSKDDEFQVRMGVAGNSNTSKETLSALSKDSDEFIREEVAKNKNITPEIEQRLINDSYNDTRLALAMNPSISSDSVEKLANDKNPYVRGGAARNPKCSPSTLTRLANEDNNYIKKNVAVNKNTPLETLEKLSNDVDESVRKYATETSIAVLNDTMKKVKSIVNKQKDTIDLSKLSPHLRDKLRDLSPEEQKAFLLWLKENK